MKKFAIIGTAGYVAPRHLQAIKDTGNEVVAALDPNDSVGILDRYFPNCKFFTQQERFDRHVVKHDNLDYVSICSPNYLHESHCKLAMRLGADVICEKPLCMTVENLKQLQKVEQQTNKKVYSILQLRLHPSIKLLKNFVDLTKMYHVNLHYITPRGPWYFHSWKGNEKQSGGIETNIGVHFFDMLIWLFGHVLKVEIEHRDEKVSKGKLYLKRAIVNWYLSLDRNDLPEQSQNFYRSMEINGEEIRFDNVFSELHTESYRDVLSGCGFGIEDTLKSIELVQQIRES
jgi:UDP-N-acetyl-2-amino-2-deoxyglucuronate dehydrogenase